MEKIEDRIEKLEEYIKKLEEWVNWVDVNIKSIKGWKNSMEQLYPISEISRYDAIVISEEADHNLNQFRAKNNLSRSQAIEKLINDGLKKNK